VAKTYRQYDPNQSFLLPPNPRDWLPEGHIALFVDDLVDKLDLSKVYAPYEREERGYPPHDPRMMVKILFYAYTQRVFSSRQMERKCTEDVGFRVLSGGNKPDHVSLSRFRKKHLSDLADLFTQVLRMCQSTGLVKLGHVSLDGTKIKANASRHKAMSWERLNKEEQRLQEEIEEELRDGAKVDEEEDEAGDGVPNILPPGFATKKERLQRIEEAKRRLEERAKKEREDGVPDPKMQTNFTDPESRIMPTSSPKGAFEQAYNAQLIVDAKEQVIVAADVGQVAPDTGYLPSMVDQVKANTGRPPKKLSADAGYFSQPNLDALRDREIEAFIPPDRPKHSDSPPAAPRGRIPKALGLKDRMRRFLRTRRGRMVYGRRKAIVEPPIGLIKRVLGFRRFNLRGHQHARDEWRFEATVYNAMRLFWTGKPLPARA